MADTLLETIGTNEYDMIVVPGGRPGVDTLAKSALLVEMLRKQKAGNRFYCAISAAPSLVFGANGLIDDEYATAYPGFDMHIKQKRKFKEKIVISHKCSTRSQYRP